MAFLITISVIIIELLIVGLLHTEYNVPSIHLATIGIFVGWANAFLYLYLEG